MKYEILKKEVSIELLRKKIREFYKEKLRKPCYIVMCNDTLRSLNFFYNDNIEHKSIVLDSNTKFYASYDNIPIALCDYLEWGEIELI